MGALNVIVVDATGSRSRDVTLPDDRAVGRVIERLVVAMGLPAMGPDGAPISYRFHHRASGRQLADTETLAGANVHEGDTLRLTPEIVAG